MNFLHCLNNKVQTEEELHARQHEKYTWVFVHIVYIATIRYFTDMIWAGCCFKRPHSSTRSFSNTKQILLSQKLNQEREIIFSYSLSLLLASPNLCIWSSIFSCIFFSLNSCLNNSDSNKTFDITKEDIVVSHSLITVGCVKLLLK